MLVKGLSMNLPEDEMPKHWNKIVTIINDGSVRVSMVKDLTKIHYNVSYKETWLFLRHTIF